MSQFRQRVGCYAVLRRGHEILLCQLGRREKDAGRWTLPGGGMDFGETPEQTVVREVFEETGYKVRVGKILASYAEGIVRGQFRFQSVQIVYEAEVIGGELRHEKNGSTLQAAWLHPEEAAKLMSVPLVTRTLAALATDE